MSPLIVGRSDSLEPLLTSSIPDLKLDGLSVNVNCSDFEVYTNGWHEVVMEYIILSKDNQLIVSYDIFPSKEKNQIRKSDGEKITNKYSVVYLQRIEAKGRTFLHQSFQSGAL